MAEMLFTFDKGNFRECQELFRGPRAQEYYRGTAAALEKAA